MKNNMKNETEAKKRGESKSGAAEGKKQRAQRNNSNVRRQSSDNERSAPRRQMPKDGGGKRRRSNSSGLQKSEALRSSAETDKPQKRKNRSDSSQSKSYPQNKNRRQNSTAKKSNKPVVLSRKDYGDEFYTDELELKRRRSRQRHGREEKLPQIDLDKRPMSHRSRKIKNIGIAAVIVTIILTIGIVLSLTVFFRTEEFTVEGAEHYSAQDIIDASGMTLGENLFLSDKKTGEENIELELPYIEQADISIKIPNTIVITVTESEPSFIVQNGDEYAILNAEGKVLEKVSGSVDNYDVPMILGCTIKTAQPGQLVEFNEGGILSIMQSVDQALKENEFSGIKEIDLTNTASISLNYSNRIKIIIGLPEDVSYKLKTAKIIIDEKLSESDRGRLDVSGCKEGNKASYFKPISDLYLDKIEQEDITQSTQPSTEPPTQQTTEAVSQDTVPSDSTAASDDYSGGVPRNTLPTDAYGNILYDSSDTSVDDNADDYSAENGGEGVY